MQTLMPGDKCCVQRAMKRHYGIYVGRDSSGRRVFVHNVPAGGVAFTRECEFAQGQRILVEQRASPQHRAAVVRRARSLIGRSYDLLAFNCEHAANLAATGKAESSQVQRAMVTLAMALGAIWMNENETALDGRGYRRDRNGRFATRRWW